MSAPVTVEAQLLARASQLLQGFAAAFGRDAEEARFQALEAAAVRMGTHDLVDFHAAFGREKIINVPKLQAIGAALIEEIDRTDIPGALALSALAREDLSRATQKKTGAYHTDFRLARRIAELAAPGLGIGSRVVDPACGAGILLSALTIEVCGTDRKMTADWLRHSVCATDLSEVPLRGALISLASLTDDIDALVAMRKRWATCDSLLADPKTWTKMAPNGFDAVIANPPWEKVKLTRHEFLQAAGQARHYGSEVTGLDQTSFRRKQDEVSSYAQRLVRSYPIIAKGEPDLYMAFLSLHMKLLRPGGRAAILVPGGLIRSQGTEAFRRELFGSASDVSVSVFDNRARFFSIDTRFKFLALAATKAGLKGAKREPIKLLHEHGSHDGVVINGCVRIGRSTLADVRPDLSLPEVSSELEWKLFCKLATGGERMDDPTSSWLADFCREVDMTSDRPDFVSRKMAGTFPVIEGRQVHQHRFGAKGYVSGSGRASIWQPYPMGESRVRSQFFIAAEACSRKTLARAAQVRAGFCDIAGQTNERSMMAALIPPGVVCGNKVPTVMFPNDASEDRLLVWLAIVNSLTFDWMLRRVLTTTINYFVLLGLPMPKLAKGGMPWRRMVAASRELQALDAAGHCAANQARAAALRAQIEAEVALAYGANLSDLVLMLDDFPLLDRGQPPLPGEPRSTLTKDSILAESVKRGRGIPKGDWEARCLSARKLGATPFVPAQMGGGMDEQGDEGYGR